MPDPTLDLTPPTPPADIADIVEPEDALPAITFADLPPALQQAAARAGWASLMPVQAKAIPYLLARRDLMVQSRTGSGKTGAFILPTLQRIDPSKAVCQALVLVPTRELAKQVAHEAEVLAGAAGVRSVAMYGGVGYGPQLDALRQGAHLVIGTPGRVLDHLLRRNLRLDDLQILIFDEADRMLSMGFYPDMIEVRRYLPRHAINAYMFSATFPSYVMRLAHQFLTRPDFLSLSRDRVHVDAADHILYETPPMDRDRSLVRLIEVENPASALIFCNTKNTVHYVNVVLQRFGYDADELSSDLSQQAREKVLTQVREGNLRFLVATDVAARGLDIPELSHVFLYEPPEDPESYIHRAGRTARAGAGGVVISLISGMGERLQIDRLAKRYGIALEDRPLPTAADVAAIVAERVTALLEAKLRQRDKLQSERMQRFTALAGDWAGSEEGRSLLAMLIDDFYQASLHAPLLPSSAADEGAPRGERAANPAARDKRPREERRRGGRRRPKN